MDINGYKWTIFVKKSRKKPSTQFCIFMHFFGPFLEPFSKGPTYDMKEPL